MQVRNIVIATAVVAVLGAVAYLLLAVRTPPEVEVPEREVTQAPVHHEDRTIAVPGEQTPRPEAADSSSPGRPKVVPGKVTQESDAPRGENHPMRPIHPGNKLARSLTASDEFKGQARRISPLGEGGIPEEIRDRMAEVNRRFDDGDHDGALDLAKGILEERPGNIRMLRVVVSSACITGDEEVARRYLDALPPHHQEQMRRRCAKHGMNL